MESCEFDGGDCCISNTQAYAICFQCICFSSKFLKRSYEFEGKLRENISGKINIYLYAPNSDNVTLHYGDIMIASHELFEHQYGQKGFIDDEMFEMTEVGFDD